MKSRVRYILAAGRTDDQARRDCVYAGARVVRYLSATVGRALPMGFRRAAAAAALASAAAAATSAARWSSDAAHVTYSDVSYISSPMVDGRPAAGRLRTDSGLHC